MNKFVDIICTIGPASWELEVLSKMIQNGMTVARINGAFADTSELERVENLIKEAAAKNGKEIFKDVKLLMDIKGVEVRLNKFSDDVEVKLNDKFTLGSKPEHNIYPGTYPELFNDLVSGNIIKIDKGKVELVVESVDYKLGLIHCVVTKPGFIRSGRGMNLPEIKLDNLPFTEIDRFQAKYALEHGWNYIAGSLIGTKEQVITIRKEIDSLSKHHDYKFISKIENKFGIENIAEIAEVSDGIMIGRGDMAVEIGYEKVPEAQKFLQKFSRENNLYHIVATEMLESMINSTIPSNSDISDITKAILEGADAIMLSGETTMGNHPSECVAVMKKLIEYNS